MNKCSPCEYNQHKKCWHKSGKCQCSCSSKNISSPKVNFISSIQNTYEQGINLIRKKNADYANNSNPFKNFESAVMAGVSVERAILVRVLDKISRISNLLEKDRMVLDETLEDSLLDAINYLAILKARLESSNLKGE